MANRNIAGTFYLVAGGQRFEAIGEATIEPSPVERSADVTSGGRLYGMTKASARRAKMKFARFEDAAPSALFLSSVDSVQVTIVENETQKRHLFINALIVGKPSENLATGEVDGIEIASDQYQLT
jgi:hypothetical protein